MIISKMFFKSEFIRVENLQKVTISSYKLQAIINSHKHPFIPSSP